MYPSDPNVSAFSWWRRVGLEGYNLRLLENLLNPGPAPAACAALEAGVRSWPRALAAYSPVDSEQPWPPLPL